LDPGGLFSPELGSRKKNAALSLSSERRSLGYRPVESLCFATPFHFRCGKLTDVQPPCTVAFPMNDAHPTVSRKCNGLNGSSFWI
jgi:hypothetical protein